MTLAPLSDVAKAYVCASAYAWLNILEGGKRAGKNIINILAWFLSLQYHPDKLHLAAGVTIALAQMNILDNDGKGLGHFFGGRCRPEKYNGKEALRILTLDGKEKFIIFAGGGKAGSAALIKGISFGSIYISEVNECNREFVLEAMDRTIASKNRKIFFDLNPKVEGHWFYSEIKNPQEERQKKGAKGLNFAHVDLTDNYSLANETIRDIMAAYDHTSARFLSDICGLRVASAGIIYASYHRDVVSISMEEIRKKRFFELAVGIDVGGTDATCATLAGLTSDMQEVILIDGLYHHQGLDDRVGVTDYVRQIIAFLTPYSKALPYPMTVYVDSANKLFRIELQKAIEQCGLSRLVVRAFNKKDGIGERINFNLALLEQGRFRVRDKLREWHTAYEMAVWDGKAHAQGKWVRVDDGSVPIDCLDSAEYAMYNFRKRMKYQPLEIGEPA